MIALGKFNTLRIDHSADHGLYLSGDEATGDILLPNRYVTPGMRVGRKSPCSSTSTRTSAS